MIERLLAPWLLTGLFTGLVPIDAALYSNSTDALTVDSLLPVSATVRDGFPVSSGALPPKKRVLQNYQFAASADSILLLDVASGELMYGKNIDDPRAIGSISKLMTALVFLESSPDLSASVQLLEQDRTYGGRFYLPFETSLTVGDLLGAALVGSDNSATTALVRMSGMTQEAFVARMNARAAELGLTHTSFEDWTGLSSHNLSTARDVARLLRVALEQPELARRMHLPVLTVTAGGVAYEIPSTNALMGTLVAGEGTITGGKTGYIPEAGYCVTARVMRGERQGMDVVILSSRTKDGRFADLAEATRWAYETFEWPAYE